MNNSTIFDKVTELKDRFKSFFRSKKKLQALENYSQVVPFSHREYLILIKRCMTDGFLGDKEADFLTYMTDKYFSEANYLDWTHKTKWLKGEMKKLAVRYAPQEEQREVVQLPLFDFSKTTGVAAHVPFELLAQKHRAQVTKRL